MTLAVLTTPYVHLVFTSGQAYPAAMDRRDWKAETLTARDVVPHRDVILSIDCPGCRLIRELNVWTIGARLADDPLQQLRFRCRRCGVYPSEMQVRVRNSSVGEHLLTIPLKPRCWDDGHREDQAAALRRASQSKLMGA